MLERNTAGESASCFLTFNSETSPGGCQVFSFSAAGRRAGARPCDLTIRAQSVDSEAAMLYTMRHEDEDAKEDAHIWISKKQRTTTSR